jgi:RND family efflux transporter MFP subunit
MALALHLPGRSPGGETSEREGVAKPFREVTVSVSIREIIDEMKVEEGEVVKKGQVVATLRSEKQALAVDRLLQMTRKAEFDYNAAKRLFEQKVASRDDAFESEVELRRLEAELGMARADLEERKIVAPISGVVVRKFKESGESIAENDPILQLLEVKQLLLLFHLEASLLSKVKLGQEFAVRFPEIPEIDGCRAKVMFIDPEVDSRSGLFRVRLLLDNEDGLVRPGLRVLADFPVRSGMKQQSRP